jgi:hypothetical protein
MKTPKERNLVALTTMYSTRRNAGLNCALLLTACFVVGHRLMYNLKNGTTRIFSAGGGPRKNWQDQRNRELASRITCSLTGELLCVRGCHRHCEPGDHLEYEHCDTWAWKVLR